MIGTMIFNPAARYPADPRAIFVLAASVFTGLTSLAIEAAPASLEAVLPQWAVMGWAAMLTLGSAMTLMGMMFQTVNGILTEQLGSVVVGVTAIFYSGVAFSILGLGGIAAYGLIGAWGVACLFRWFQLQALINKSHRRHINQQIVESIEEEIGARAGRES